MNLLKMLFGSRKPALNKPAVISWVAASEKLPSVEQNGKKVWQFLFTKRQW